MSYLLTPDEYTRALYVFAAWWSMPQNVLPANVVLGVAVRRILY